MISRTKRVAGFAALFLLVVVFCGAVTARAQTDQSSTPAPAKSYYYPSIATTIVVNKDSTIDVTEDQTFAFVGNFHAGERDISLQKISGVTDVSVTDLTTGVPFTQSGSRLDITDPSSWGRFAVWKDAAANSEDVEWYFNLDNATHTWAISYKVHGAIEFGRSYDRLYWNIFSGYDVPVEHAAVAVILPEAAPASAVSETSYRTNSLTPTSIQNSYASGTFTFVADLFRSNEAYTIDAAWPKGIVSEQAFWWDLLLLNLPLVTMGGVIMLCLFALVLWWLFAVKLRERPGNIIPQYEPPEGLRPAVAEVVALERVTSKGFAATIVDLAVRGFVRIEEDNTPGISPTNVINIFLGAAFVIIIFIYGAPLTAAALLNRGGWNWVVFVPGFVILVLIALQVVGYFRRGLKRSDYRITSLKDFANDTTLKDYEKRYLSLIFSIGDGTSVSTKDFKKLLGYNAQQFHKSVMELRKEIGAEANSETSAFAVFHVGSGAVARFIPLAFLLVVYFFFTTSSVTWLGAGLFSVIAIAATVWVIIRMARRTKQGKILRDEWLGFKLYLEVAEKYQLQNLTPDLFEKYLPYAMIFGIEKKWARVFERANITLVAPQWYGGAPAAAGMAARGVGAGAAFSAGAFSSGFSASFSSAIASSIGGGGAGGAGGGGAGGGGGGGGGGAR